MWWIPPGAAALFLGSANPLVHLPLLIVLYPAALYTIGLTAPQPFRRGWCAGLAGATGGLYWISVAVHDYGGFPWPLAVPCAVLLGMYMGLWGGLFAWLIRLLRPLPAWRRCTAAALLWYLGEWTRGWFCTGFPWLTLASGQSPWPVLIQSASVIGAYGLSGLLAGLGCLLAEAVLAAGDPSAPRSPRPFLLSACGLLGLLLLFGAARLYQADREADPGLPLTLSLIQGNVRQDLKWDPAFQRATVDRYLTLSAGAVAAEHPDALIWPETSMPFFFQEGGPLSGSVRAFTRDSGTALLFGGPAYGRRQAAAPALYNRAFFLDARGDDAGHYDKEHLVPFGEYLPPVLDSSLFASLMQGLGGFSPGASLPPLRLMLPDRRGEAMLGALICYEAVFPELARARVAEGAQILVNISNDAWYNRSSAPAQHLYLALLRSVEQERWLARATNTGLTAFADPWGRLCALGDIRDGSGLFIEASLTRTVRARSGRTLYFVLHPWLPSLAFLLFLFILWPLARCWRAQPPNAGPLRGFRRKT
ncbi:MAG: apolipoprotein N-acyltransferase [Desulfovibrionaceae bacterium]|nr:apolipoprotein N-acyltransferase [Desulfovibrionaceae bacterium]